MNSGKNLAEQTRSLIDRLNVRQVMISNQLKTITNETPGILKKSKSVTFLDEESQMKVVNSFESNHYMFFSVILGITTTKTRRF
jgi:hypothetical protein